MREFMLAMMLVFALGCTDRPATERILRDNGYTDIEITGYAAWMAADDDMTSTGFRAKSPSGHVVEGAVTGGGLKGYTIRLK